MLNRYLCLSFVCCGALSACATMYVPRITAETAGGEQYAVQYMSHRGSCSVEVTHLVRTPGNEVVRTPEPSVSQLRCGYPGSF